MPLVITELAQTGSETSYAVPADTLALSFQATGNDIDMYTTTAVGTTSFGILANSTFSINGRSISGQTIYFIDSDGSGTLHIARQSGVGC